MTIDAQIVEPDGTPVGSPFKPLEAQWSDERNEVGSGSVTVPLDHALAPDLRFPRQVRMRHNGTVRFAFEIGLEDVDRQQAGEHAGQVWTASGEGVGILLGTSEVGGAVVEPCGGIGSFQSDIRQFGWMDCCCYDHAAHFTDTLGMCHRHDVPDPPWTPMDPDDWPAGNAYRVFCDAPNEIVAGVNAVQTISLGTSISSGTFTLTFEGDTTANISSPWSAANVKSALDAVIDGSVSVTGSGIDSDPYVITFDGGNVAGRPVDLLGVDHSVLNHPPNGAVNPVMTTPGVQGRYATDPGCCYVADFFSTGVERNLILFVNMSEVGEIWLDGVQVYGQFSASQALGVQMVPITLPAGDHCITARVCVTSSDALGWIMWALAEAVQNDEGAWELGTVVHQTNCNMLALGTGVFDTPPGVTVGQIIECLVGEAQTAPRDEIPETVLTFDGDDDSDSTPWADEVVWGVKIGSGYLDAVQQLVELIGAEWEVSPTHQLSVWQDRGSASGVTFVDADILLSPYSTSRAVATMMLIETQEGLTPANDAAGVAAFGHRRIGLTLGTAPTYEGLADFAVKTFAHFARRVTGAMFATWGPAGKVPYANFGKGDTLTAPNPVGTGVSFRCVGIQAEMQSDGQPIWTWIGVDHV